ncbi:hypothetical protein PHSY_000605 [Pseudozyma hubeiensis SY62]|uniref:Uncharacterized protein n=1 Tax=Pseudozyma hubeiensis (strain SY62) TaxID=1305764 RepID=R9NWW1_PSEHS|nr:hypothetical protein PHSY_000605 [Pseudozyma hubeiensis SY62]GAC93044.1 hypothetical protein PHSY_000605 [Pseudozyma hubeiensis SY62]
MDNRYPFASHESDVPSSVWAGSSSSAPQLGTNLPSSETHSSYPYSRYSSIQHSPLRLERSQSADTPLDQEALQILDSLLNDLNADRQSGHSHAALGESTGSTSAGTSAQDLSRKGTRQWWEPQSFNLLPYVPPLSQGSGKIDQTRNDDPRLRDELDMKVFAGKLTWAPDADMDHVQPRNFREASPFTRYHRILPSVHSTAPDGLRLPIRMTAHSNAPILSGAPEGSVLHNRPFYLLWSATTTPDGRRHLISYGTAHIDPADYETIDSHLRSLLEDAADTSLAY